MAAQGAPMGSQGRPSYRAFTVNFACGLLALDELPQGELSTVCGWAFEPSTVASWTDRPPRIGMQLCGRGCLTVTEVAVGHEYSLARTDDGKIFSWGCCTVMGALGHGNGENQPEPKQIMSDVLV